MKRHFIKDMKERTILRKKKKKKLWIILNKIKNQKNLMNIWINYLKRKKTILTSKIMKNNGRSKKNKGNMYIMKKLKRKKQ